MVTSVLFAVIGTSHVPHNRGLPRKRLNSRNGNLQTASHNYDIGRNECTAATSFLRDVRVGLHSKLLFGLLWRM